MNYHRPLRIALLLLGVALVPVLAGIGWKLSPGREAYLGALAYWPLLFLGLVFSTPFTIVLYYRRSVHSAAQIVPGVVIGGILLCTFLTLDYRRERAELTTEAGIRGVIYEDTSGEFGVEFRFSSYSPEGELIGEEHLGFAMEPHERQYFLRGMKGGIQVYEGSNPGQVVAWYSPASNRVLSYRTP